MERESEEIIGNAGDATQGAAGGGMSRRERFCRACRCEAVDYPPVWLMRQAGRVLPEYRALKESHSFVEMVRTPDLAVEVTLQPIRRFDFDAAILFSDILVIPEAMGQGYCFRESGGIAMDFAIRGAEDIRRLEPDAVVERLAYVDRTLRVLRRELGERTALIGFSGTPWTLANFMLAGGSAVEFNHGKEWFYSEPGLFEALMEKLTRAVSDYLRMQIDAGVDAVQLFDSLGGRLSSGAYSAASGKWIRRIIGELEGRVPVILFARGCSANWEDLVRTGPQVLSVDWTADLRNLVRQLAPDTGVQGNLDPYVLTTNPKAVAREVQGILEAMRDRPGHIFNLGHGVPPEARLENIECLLDTVRKQK